MSAYSLNSSGDLRYAIDQSVVVLLVYDTTEYEKCSLIQIERNVDFVMNGSVETLLIRHYM